MKALKRSLALLLCLCLALSPAGAALAAGSDTPTVDAGAPIRSGKLLYGDADGNGKVNARDATIVLRCDAGAPGAEDIDQDAADVDGNDKVNARDATLILRYDAGAIDRFPAEPVVPDESLEGLGFRDPENVQYRSPEELQDWSIDVQNSTVTLPAGEALPEPGQIILLGAQQAIRVESAQTDDDGAVVLSYSTPELYEFLDSINIEGNGQMDPSGFVPADGVTVLDSPSPQAGGVYNDGASMVTTISVDIPLAKGGSVTTEAELAFTNVYYSLDADIGPFGFVDVHNALFLLEKSISYSVNVNIDDPLEQTIPLGTVPILGASEAVGLSLKLDLVINASGEVRLEQSIAGAVGFYIEDNTPRIINSLQDDGMTVAIKAEMSAGLSLYFAIGILNQNLLDAGMELGGKAIGEYAIRSSGLVCMDANCHMYFKAYMLNNCLLNDWLGLDLALDIWDEDNSPLRLSGHWENLSYVTACSWDDSIVEPTPPPESVSGVCVDSANFPDERFRSYVAENIDLDKSGALSESERLAVINISVANAGIYDLTGLSHFPNLLTLSCQENSLSELDLSNNPTLGDLICYGNYLEELDLSQSPELAFLSCGDNQLRSLDVSQNTKLETLRCEGNQLTELTLGPALSELSCYDNQLTALDVSGCPDLFTLMCRQNQLTALDVSQNLWLSEFDCSENDLTDLNVVNNFRLAGLWCNDNALTDLDLSGNPDLTVLYCGNNALTVLDLSANPDLSILDYDSGVEIIRDTTSFASEDPVL